MGCGAREWRGAKKKTRKSEPRVEREFAVEDGSVDVETLKEELQTEAIIRVVCEDEALSLDELQLEDRVHDQEAIIERTPVSSDITRKQKIRKEERKKE